MTRHPPIGSALSAALLLTVAACTRGPLLARQSDGAMADDPDAAAAAHAAMAHGAAPADPHMRMTAPRAASHADSVRAAALLARMRRDLAAYRDVRRAEADGYRPFLPDVPQPVYHFTSVGRAFAEAFRFEPARPTSLLYRRQADGRYTLIGAMYTAPRRLSEAELDERLPLGIVRWHQHVNWCTPPKGDRRRWLEQRDGHPVFGPQSPIATRAACDSVGGVFHPHLFGWMAHVNAFAREPWVGH